MSPNQSTILRKREKYKPVTVPAAPLKKPLKAKGEYPGYMSSGDIHKFFNINSKTFKRWIKSGKFPPPDVRTEAGWSLWAPITCQTVLRTFLANGRKLVIPNKEDNLQTFYSGDEVIFTSRERNTRMNAEVIHFNEKEKEALIRIKGDPFSVRVRAIQLELRKRDVTERKETMATATAKGSTELSAKDLRDAAKNLSIKKWQGMNRAELEAAIALAEGGTTEKKKSKDKEVDEVATEKKKIKKAKKEIVEEAPKIKKKAKLVEVPDEKPVKKKKKKKVEAKAKITAVVETGETTNNPFRKGSNLYFITEALKKGGHRDRMVEKLRPKMKTHPTVLQASYETDTLIIAARLMSVARLLKNQYDWTIQRDGRGEDSYIKGIPPS